MMLTVNTIDTGLFPKLFRAFLVDDDPLSTEEDWRNVFDYHWETEEQHCGYALLADGEVVGMIGMIFSERWIAGELKKFCNLHTWWVREDHRGRSLALLRPALKLTDYTVTHFTPCDKVRAISKRLGYQDLSTQLTILPVINAGRATDPSQPVDDLPTIRQSLSEIDARIFDDHQPYGCGHLMVGDARRPCYILYTHVVRHRLPYCHIHYMSDKGVFAQHVSQIRSWLGQRHGVRLVALDTRLTEGMKLPLAFRFWAPSNGLYQSRDVKPSHIDNLYSDIVCLKLTTLPDLSYELLKRAKACLRLAGLSSD